MPFRPLPPVREYLARAALAALVLLSVGLGIAGYHWIVGLSWIDAYLNSAMLLSGEGPLAPTPAGTLLAGTCAIFGGIVFVTAAALSPSVLRVLHRFHLAQHTAEPA